MKIGIRIILIIAIIHFVSTGESAAFEVKYELVRAEIPEAQKTINKKVAVIVFDDARPDIEKFAKARHAALIENADYYTADEIYTIDKAKDIATVAQQISKMIAAHLEYCKLFGKIDYINLNTSSFVVDANRNLLKDYEVALMGEIKHYYGFYKSAGGAKYQGIGVVMGVAGGAVGGALGGLIESDQEALLPKEIEGYTFIKNIRLVDLNSGKIVWSGEVKEHFKDTKKKYLSSQYQEAHKSLKDAINRLVQLIAVEYRIE